MCGRFTVKMTWAEIVAMYRLTDRPPHNLQPRYNVCSTDPIGVITEQDGKRDFVRFAGLWDTWKDRATGETLKSCTMIITEPSDFVAEIHDRMPVILERENFEPWLRDGGTALLKPAESNVLRR
jgi:putative SOS response-associated peptidase YedK